MACEEFPTASSALPRSACPAQSGPRCALLDDDARNVPSKPRLHMLQEHSPKRCVVVATVCKRQDGMQRETNTQSQNPELGKWCQRSRLLQGRLLLLLPLPAAVAALVAHFYGMDGSTRNALPSAQLGLCRSAVQSTRAARRGIKAFITPPVESGHYETQTDNPSRLTVPSPRAQ